MLKVEAVDRDRGINDDVTYIISSENKGGRMGCGRGRGSVRAAASSCSCRLLPDSTRPGWFDIGPDGVISVSGALDREQLLEEDEEVQVQVTVSEALAAPIPPPPLSSDLGSQLSLSTGSLTSALWSLPRCQATEVHPNIYGQEAKVSIWVTLRVTDVNDHKPEFFNCSLPTCTFTPQEAQVSFTGSVDEHSSTRIPIDGLTMVAYDPDKAGAPPGEGTAGGCWETAGGGRVLCARHG